jgi:hypothetical protein
MHPVHGAVVDVPHHDKQLARYYQRDGWQPVDAELPPIEDNVGRELTHPGFGEPMNGTEVPLGEEAEITNVPDDEPGEPTPDSGDHPDAGTSLEL